MLFSHSMSYWLKILLNISRSLPLAIDYIGMVMIKVSSEHLLHIWTLFVCLPIFQDTNILFTFWLLCNEGLVLIIDNHLLNIYHSLLSYRSLCYHTSYAPNFVFLSCQKSVLPTYLSFCLWSTQNINVRILISTTGKNQKNQQLLFCLFQGNCFS